MKKIVLLACVFSVLLCRGQEFNMPLLSQYMAENPYVISPTFAGIGPYFQLRVSGLEQWVGVSNAPGTQSVSLDGRFGDVDGVGILLFNDENGNTRQYGGLLSYAHHLTLNDYRNQFLSFGISYRFTQFKIDVSKFNGDDPSVYGDKSTFNSNFDVGVLYRFESFYFSLNASNILDKSARAFADSEPVKLRNYSIYTGFKFLENPYHQLEVSLFGRYFESDGRSSTDVNVKYRKIKGDDYVWAGASVRLLNDLGFKPASFTPMIGFKRDNFYVSYGFEITLGDIIQYNVGTHLITLGVDFLYNPSSRKCTQ
ncbi:MAG: type IX secretion system membrane protein PorP/SprF [Flavobacteriaceae bacterium]|nr:type IX secretion system membrane protein PorP/SprF [Flavobacteriaceae bacterium]